MLPMAHLSSFFLRTFAPTVPPRFTLGTIKLLQCGKKADTSKRNASPAIARRLPWQWFNHCVEWLNQSSDGSVQWFNHSPNWFNQ